MEVIWSDGVIGKIVPCFKIYETNLLLYCTTIALQISWHSLYFQKIVESTYGALQFPRFDHYVLNVFCRRLSFGLYFLTWPILICRRFKKWSKVGKIDMFLCFIFKNFALHPWTSIMVSHYSLSHYVDAKLFVSEALTNSNAHKAHEGPYALPKYLS